jgi:hypothetical protein
MRIELGHGMGISSLLPVAPPASRARLLSGARDDWQSSVYSSSNRRGGDRTAGDIGSRALWVAAQLQSKAGRPIMQSKAGRPIMQSKAGSTGMQSKGGSTGMALAGPPATTRAPTDVAYLFEITLPSSARSGAAHVSSSALGGAMIRQRYCFPSAAAIAAAAGAGAVKGAGAGGAGAAGLASATQRMMRAFANAKSKKTQGESADNSTNDDTNACSTTKAKSAQVEGRSASASDVVAPSSAVPALVSGGAYIALATQHSLGIWNLASGKCAGLVDLPTPSSPAPCSAISTGSGTSLSRTGSRAADLAAGYRPTSAVFHPSMPFLAVAPAHFSSGEVRLYAPREYMARQ